MTTDHKPSFFSRWCNAVGIVLCRFVRRPVVTGPTQEEIHRYTEAIAQHDAFWLIEYPINMAILSAEISAARMSADMARAEAQREQAEGNARDFTALMARIPPNTGTQTYRGTRLS